MTQDHVMTPDSSDTSGCSSRAEKYSSLSPQPILATEASSTEGDGTVSMIVSIVFPEFYFPEVSDTVPLSNGHINLIFDIFRLFICITTLLYDYWIYN